jgi:hypothetical protein
MNPELVEIARSTGGVSQEALERRLGIEPGQLDAWLARAKSACTGGEARHSPREEERIALNLAEELEVLTRLRTKAREKQRELGRRDLRDVMAEPSMLARVRDNSPESISLLQELEQRAFGKSVTLRRLENGASKTYRVAQANYGFPELTVLNRLSPVASKLVPARLRDKIEMPVGGLHEVIGLGYLEPQRIAVDRESDFTRADLIADGLDVRIEGARTTLARLLWHLFDGLEASDEVATFDFTPPQEDLVRADEASLSARFYTRTTELQEALLRRDSSGLVVVHGVAGSGKTSVALGRAKVLCDRGPAEGEAEPDFFRPGTAIGFVLSDQLSAYLKRTCALLSLHEMPIREYHAFRRELMDLRKLDDHDGFKGTSDNGTEAPLLGRMVWLRAVDRRIARHLAEALREAVAEIPGEAAGRRADRTTGPRTSSQNAELESCWTELRSGVEMVCRGLERTDSETPTRGLVQRLDDLRAQFAEALAKKRSWAVDGQVGSERQQRQALRQNVRNALRERLTRALRLPSLYAAVVAESSLELELTGQRGIEPSEVTEGLRAVRRRLNDRRLSDGDLDVLLAILHLMTTGYSGRNDQDPISHLVQSPRYSQVFIDEYQDFNEIQLFLMGQAADPRRDAVTVVGDLCQRLSGAAVPDLAACFPGARRENTVPHVLLDNLRQQGRLAKLSQLTRELLLGEPHAELGFPETGAAPRYIATRRDRWADAVLNAVVDVRRDHSVAVLCPNRAMAAELQRELADDLRETYRDSMMSGHADLVRRFYVHFTTPLEAKGLEFDAVVVAGVDDFNLRSATEVNALYVAISRPRESLALIGTRAPLGGPIGTVLRRAGADLEEDHPEQT